MSYIEIDNIICGYRNGFHLEAISLLLSKGSFSGIIGPNGSGKSTFFKALIGDIPVQGKVIINGIDLLSLSLKKRARVIAIVSQFIEISPINVKDYVLMGRIPYRKSFQFSYTEEDNEIASKYMELTGILHLQNKLITELSGGEQQMVSIACALTQQPLLLLLDEPTSHLDITYQSKIMNLLQKLNKENGLTVLMILHDLNLASEYCDYLTLMKKGKVLIQGTPKDVLTYQNIEEAYDTLVIVKNNPLSNKPVVFPVSEKTLINYQVENKI